VQFLAKKSSDSLAVNSPQKSNLLLKSTVARLNRGDFKPPQTLDTSQASRMMIIGAGIASLKPADALPHADLEALLEPVRAAQPPRT
jgi:hypothetical protein